MTGWQGVGRARAVTSWFEEALLGPRPAQLGDHLLGADELGAALTVQAAHGDGVGVRLEQLVDQPPVDHRSMMLGLARIAEGDAVGTGSCLRGLGTTKLLSRAPRC